MSTTMSPRSSLVFIDRWGTFGCSDKVASLTPAYANFERREDCAAIQAPAGAREEEPDRVESVRANGRQRREIVLGRLEAAGVEKITAPSAKRLLMAGVELQAFVELLDRALVIALRTPQAG